MSRSTDPCRRVRHECTAVPRTPRGSRWDRRDVHFPPGVRRAYTPTLIPRERFLAGSYRRRQSIPASAEPSSTSARVTIRRRAPLSMKSELTTLRVTSRRQWRTWLATHHTSSPGIWLVFHKAHTGVRSIPYEDMVRE